MFAFLLIVQSFVALSLIAVVYIGFGLLGLTLSAVFFFSHDRVWALVEEKGDGRFEVVTGGNTNRNQLGFEDRFWKLVASIGGDVSDAKSAKPAG